MSASPAPPPCSHRTFGQAARVSLLPHHSFWAHQGRETLVSLPNPLGPKGSIERIQTRHVQHSGEDRIGLGWVFVFVFSDIFISWGMPTTALCGGRLQASVLLPPCGFQEHLCLLSISLWRTAREHSEGESPVTAGLLRFLKAVQQTASLGAALLPSGLTDPFELTLRGDSGLPCSL